MASLIPPIEEKDPLPKQQLVAVMALARPTLPFHLVVPAEVPAVSPPSLFSSKYLQSSSVSGSSTGTSRDQDLPPSRERVLDRVRPRGGGRNKKKQLKGGDAH